jgi:CcmD family protein
MTWMIVAYMTIWTAIFIYVLSIDRKQKTLARELDQLKNSLDN